MVNRGRNLRYKAKNSDNLEGNCHKICSVISIKNHYLELEKSILLKEQEQKAICNYQQKHSE